MNAVDLYRIGHWSLKHHIPFIPKLMHGLIFLIFNSHIPASAEIGSGTRFGYGGIATVIHHKCMIGKNCIIGHCVTIGSKSKNTGSAKIGDSVYIGPGVRILGNVKIGDGAVIGANAVVTCDVPERSIAVGVPARIIRRNIDVRDVSTHINVSEELLETINYFNSLESEK